MNIKEVKKILIQNNIYIKKKFGQNYLLDDNILKNIIDRSNINEFSSVIEIGPGLGFLTEKINEKTKQLLCYEIDTDLIPVLNNKFNNELYILNVDFLKADIKEDIYKYFGEKDVTVIGNLPYYITTAIITKIIEEAPMIKKIIIMVQKEVAMRICGKVSTKEYNGLSVLVQYYMKTEILFNVSPKCFYPEPEVESSVIMLTRKDYINSPVLNETFFFKFVRAIFSQRRKTLVNNLKKIFNFSKEDCEKKLKKLSIDINIRAEQLTLEQIINLTNLFYLN